MSLKSVTEWPKDSTLINENLHISRQSFLFKWTDQGVDENYIYPGITEVSLNSNGKPNVIHANPMLPDKFEAEAKRFFGMGMDNVSTGKFYSSAFSIVLDFRSLNDDKKYSDGVRQNGTDGVQITFKRKATAKNVKCYTYVVSDSIAQLNNTGFQKTII